jgi:hypothetical protein
VVPVLPFAKLIKSMRRVSTEINSKEKGNWEFNRCGSS